MNHFDPDRVGSDGRREIASRHYPLIGPYDSSDPDVLEYHTLLMKVAGIDGVIVDWYGTGSLWDYPTIHTAAQLLYDAVAAAGLEFAVCYEDQTLGHLISQGRIASSAAVDQARRDMDAVRDLWVDGGAYVHHEGRPLLLNFGPQHLRSGSQWITAFSGFSTDPVFLTLDNVVSGAAHGAYPWPPMWASGGGTLTPGRLTEYLNAHYARASGYEVRMGSSFPGFHDIYQEAGVRASYGFLDHRDGATLQETLDRAVTAGSQFVQLVTWNDFGEGTTIEPAVEYRYRHLEQVQETVAALRMLPFSAEDLRLPIRIYELRKSGAYDAQLDVAVRHLQEGRPAETRATLDVLSSIENNLRALEEVVIVPNPSSGPVSIQLGSLLNPATVTLFDLLGRVVARREVSAGASSVSLDPPPTPGVYVLRVRAGSELIVRTVVRVR